MSALELLSRQDATMWTDDDLTVDEGSPASHTSLSSDDFAFPQKLALHIPDGFDEMVRCQKEQLQAEEKQRLGEWVSKTQEDLLETLCPTFRLCALLVEGFRYEGRLLSLASASECPTLPKEELGRLKADTRRSYSSILNEVRRALRSSPPLPPPGQPTMSPQQYHQHIANQGIQCFASMLPYSNGLAGSVTDVRRAVEQQRSQIPAHILMDEAFHDMHTVAAPSTPIPRGSAVGATGRFIPVSMSCEHGKAEKVAAFRRRAVAKTLMQKPSGKPAVKAPMFARMRMSAATQQRTTVYGGVCIPEQPVAPAAHTE